LGILHKPKGRARQVEPPAFQLRRAHGEVDCAPFFADMRAVDAFFSGIVEGFDNPIQILGVRGLAGECQERRCVRSSRPRCSSNEPRLAMGGEHENFFSQSQLKFPRSGGGGASDGLSGPSSAARRAKAGPPQPSPASGPHFHAHPGPHSATCEVKRYATRVLLFAKKVPARRPGNRRFPKNCARHEQSGVSKTRRRAIDRAHPESDVRRAVTVSSSRSGLALEKQGGGGGGMGGSLRAQENGVGTSRRAAILTGTGRLAMRPSWGLAASQSPAVSGLPP